MPTSLPPKHDASDLGPPQVWSGRPLSSAAESRPQTKLGLLSLSVVQVSGDQVSISDPQNNSTYQKIRGSVFLIKTLWKGRLGWMSGTGRSGCPGHSLEIHRLHPQEQMFAKRPARAFLSHALHIGDALSNSLMSGEVGGMPS